MLIMAAHRAFRFGTAAPKVGGKVSRRRQNTRLTSTGLWPGPLASTGCASSSPVWPSTCSPTEAKTARSLYAPVKNPKTGAEVMPALLQPGSELGWAILAGPEPIRYSTETFQYLVFSDPKWDWHRFNAATDIDLALRTDKGLLEFTDPNLKPFFDRGGKLLMYHGWADPQVTPMNSVNYFNDVVRKLGAGTGGKSIELYMVPGMNHCGGGPGTDTFNKMAAIEQWVAGGTAPKQILASHLTNRTVDRTRPLY